MRQIKSDKECLPPWAAWRAELQGLERPNSRNTWGALDACVQIDLSRFGRALVWVTPSDIFARCCAYRLDPRKVTKVSRPDGKGGMVVTHYTYRLGTLLMMLPKDIIEILPPAPLEADTPVFVEV